MSGSKPHAQAGQFSSEQVRAVARLTRLHLTDEEVEQMRGQLSAILKHFESLSRVDTADVEPTGHTTEAHSVMREDRVSPSLPRDRVLANAPDKEGEFFRVRPVLE